MKECPLLKKAGISSDDTACADPALRKKLNLELENLKKEICWKNCPYPFCLLEMRGNIRRRENIVVAKALWNEGYTDKEIGERLGISRTTAYRYRKKKMP